MGGGRSRRLTSGFVEGTRQLFSTSFDHLGKRPLMRAVLLLSGGLDSYTAGAIARTDRYDLCALTIRYGQIHVRETEAARHVAKALGVSRHLELQVDLSAIGGSSLVGQGGIPKDRPLETDEIPSTYVPARNTVFLSLALAWAEVLEADAIVLGVNALDYSGYPDCRPEYLQAFERVAALATRADDPSPGGAPCGRCDSCVLRARGFREAGVDDPALGRSRI